MKASEELLINGFVYLAKVGHRIKVGFTTDLIRRAYQYKYIDPDFHYLHTVPGDNEVERRIIDALRGFQRHDGQKARRSEWFQESDIDSVRSVFFMQSSIARERSRFYQYRCHAYAVAEFADMPFDYYWRTYVSNPRLSPPFDHRDVV